MLTRKYFLTHKNILSNLWKMYKMYKKYFLKKIVKTEISIANFSTYFVD